MKATILIKNAETAIAYTRARILAQLARCMDYGRHDAAQNLRCVLIVLDHSLGEGADFETPEAFATRKFQKNVWQFSSALYREVRKRELARAKARKNRVADRCAA